MAPCACRKNQAATQAAPNYTVTTPDGKSKAYRSKIEARNALLRAPSGSKVTPPIS